MNTTVDLSAIEGRARRLLEIIEKASLTGLDFETREHLHVISLCMDTAIEHAKKLK
jgi:hypothetical protein